MIFFKIFFYSLAGEFTKYRGSKLVAVGHHCLRRSIFDLDSVSFHPADGVLWHTPEADAVKKRWGI